MSPSLPQSVFKNYDHDENGFISQGEFEKIAASFPFSFCVMDKAKWVVFGFSWAPLTCDIRRRGGRQGLFVVTTVATGSKERKKECCRTNHNSNHHTFSVLFLHVCIIAVTCRAAWNASIEPNRKSNTVDLFFFSLWPKGGYLDICNWGLELLNIKCHVFCLLLHLY